MDGTRYTWLLYVALAGLAWGTYVPLIFYGGSELTKPGQLGGRLMAILCVGVAYFVLAVLIPLGLFVSGQHEWPDLKTTGLVFSGLAGVAGAVGAICVIFASNAAVEAAVAGGAQTPAEKAQFRIFIAPLIFGLAPVINTLVSLVWHPKPDNPWHFGFDMPDWKLLLGIVFVGAGSFLVLLSKEQGELAKQGKPKPPPASVSTPEPTQPQAGGS